MLVSASSDDTESDVDSDDVESAVSDAADSADVASDAVADSDEESLACDSDVASALSLVASDSETISDEALLVGVSAVLPWPAAPVDALLGVSLDTKSASPIRTLGVGSEVPADDDSLLPGITSFDAGLAVAGDGDAGAPLLAVLATGVVDSLYSLINFIINVI